MEQRYTKKYIDSLEWGSEKHSKVSSDIIQRAMDNGDLYINEAILAYQILRSSYDEKGKPANTRDYSFCKEPRFMFNYMIYVNNLHGLYPARDVRNGELRELTLNEKFEDVAELHAIHEEWMPNLESDRHSDQLLQEIAKEARIELKLVRKEYSKGAFGYNLLKAKIKVISLHSRYIYLKVKEVLEELEQKEFTGFYGNIEFVVDFKSLIHIYWRHYSKVIKQIDTGKSFHADEKIKVWELPLELANFLTQIGKGRTFIPEKSIFIPIEIRGIVYAIWLKEETEYSKGKGKIVFHRVKTFYPVEEERELAKIKAMKCYRASEDLRYFSDE